MKATQTLSDCSRNMRHTPMNVHVRMCVCKYTCFFCVCMRVSVRLEYEEQRREKTDRRVLGNVKKG